MKIYVGEGQFFADGFAVRRAFSMEEGERRLISYVAREGCGCDYLSLEGETLRSEGEGLAVILRGKDAEIRPVYPTSRPPVRIEITRGEAVYRVECGRVPRSYLIVSGSAEGEYFPCRPLSSPCVRSVEGQRECIVEVSADCPEGRYLMMIALSEGHTRLLLEDYGESILCRGNEVTVKRALNDRRGRIVATRYLWQGEAFVSSREIVCTRAHPFIREEMGLLLLESVIARDESSLRELLSPEIDDVRMVEDYFGEILSVEPPLSPVSPTAVTAITRREEGIVALTYDFDFTSSGLIENIRTVD